MEIRIADAANDNVSASSPDAPVPNTDAPLHREVRYEHSRALPDLLARLHVSLLISTYQAGKLVVVGTHDGRLTLALHNFERAMGVAVAAPGMGRLALGAQRQVWLLNAAPDIAPRLPPAGQHDACFLTRSSLFTGEIQAHELALADDQLWCANTLFSCLCTLDANFSFVPRWRPPFVRALAAEDRCHLNGFALGDGGQPQYVTVIAATDVAQGWREHKVAGGCVIHVPSGQTVLKGLSMPHSPRLHGGKLWVLDSGHGRLLTVDAAAARGEVVAELPGYTRGLALHGGVAFVGLSRIRESNIFGGLPIAERGADALKCGVGAIDLATGRLLAHLEFKTGVEEIFAVALLPGIRCPALSGPYPHLDGTQTIWNAPAG